MNTFLYLGLIGFGVMAIVNAVAFWVFKHPTAAFGAPEWWSSWFSNYVVWITFTIIGIGQSLFGKPRK